MALKSLSSRAIMGEFARAIETPTEGAFVDPLTLYIPDSNQFVEEHRFLSAIPGLIPWMGSRRIKELRDYGQKIENLPFEATLTVRKDEVKFDKTGQVQNRIDAWKQTATDHWTELLSALIDAGTSKVCYDGQYYFDTDHVSGNSGSQSNAIQVDISDLPFPSDYKGTPTAPSPETIAHAIVRCVQQMYGFKDDEGRPINQNATKFLVMVPVTFMANTYIALSKMRLSNDTVNPLQLDQMQVVPSVNPRLTWTDAIAVFRTDGLGGSKPMIRQQMGEIEYTMLDEKSDLYHNERRMEFGIYLRRGVGYGLWQHAVRAQFVA